MATRTRPIDRRSRAPSRRSDATPRGSSEWGRSLPFDDPRHLLAHRWLVDEAWLLDAQAYETGWTCSPRTSTTSCRCGSRPHSGAGYDTSPGMAHFDEDKYSLSRRVARFLTEHAWTEDPPSRLRHHLTNVRTFEPTPDHLVVDSATLLFRSRGDVREGSFVSAGREDLLRRDGRASGSSPAEDPRRRLGPAHAEPGDLPVTLQLGGRGRDAAAATPRGRRTRRAAGHAVGEPITLANEFAEIRVAGSRPATAPGCWSSRRSPGSGSLCAPGARGAHLAEHRHLLGDDRQPVRPAGPRGRHGPS